ncbi:MAG: hypothetical protein KBS64_06630 [Treponema sp.]|nr:hypothetical protein [Candidatus Treponema equi]
MHIKNISVITQKNHIETEVFFDESDFNKDCYLEQNVYPFNDDENSSCSMMTGIPGPHVMTCADAVPVVPSTPENPFHYNLVTKVYGGDDVLLDEQITVFEFRLPTAIAPVNRKSFFSRLFSRKD